MQDQSEAFVLSVQSIVFGGLLTLLLTFILWHVQQWSLRRERRCNLATAMLIELWTIDWVVRTIFEDPAAAESKGTIPISLFADAPRTALEFPSDVLFRVLMFRGLCADVDIIRQRARIELVLKDNGAEETARVRRRTKELNYLARCKAGFALNVVPALRTDMLALGAVWNEPEPVRQTEGGRLPDVPPSPFHRHFDPVDPLAD